MIQFNNWVLYSDGKFSVRQYDNLTRRLEIEGDIPDDWEFSLMVRISKDFNVISLIRGENGLYVDLTSDMIPINGMYQMQLKGTYGKKVRHSNIIQIYVGESMSGDVEWPEIPSEFTQIEERVKQYSQNAEQAADAAKKARDQYPIIIGDNWNIYDPEIEKYVDTGVKASGEIPYIGENGNWYVGVVDTGVRAQGPKGEQGEKGIQGEQGERGEKGEKGEQGEQGIQGEKGEQGIPGLDAPQINDNIISTSNPWSSKKIIDTLVPSFEVSGSIVTCNPIEKYPLHVISIINPVQAGSGDPSPDNVRPISGWDSANLWHGGTNLLKLENRELVKTGNFVNTAKRSLNGNKLFIGISRNNYFNPNYVESYEIGSDFVKITTNFINYGLGFDFLVKPGCTYVFSSSFGTNEMAFYAENGEYITRKVSPATAPDNAKYGLVVFLSEEEGIETTWTDARVTVSSQENYEPYRGNYYSLPFGQTVYGASLDWATGVLTITKKFLVFDGSEDEKWENVGTNNAFRFPKCLIDAIPATSGGNGQSNYGLARGSELYNGTSYGVSVNDIFIGINDVCVRFETVDTLSALREKLFAQPVQVVYDLNTTETIQLSPTEILALSGTNTLYSDTGDTTVSSRESPIYTINNLRERIAALESNISGV